MEIIDQKNLNQVIQSVFLKIPVLLSIEEGKSFSVEILSYENEKIKISYFETDTKSKRRVLIASIGKIFICTLEYLDVDEFGNEILKPIKINIIEDKKIVTRNLHTKGKLKKECHVTNIISQGDIKKFLNDDKIKEIIKSNSYRLVHLFNKYNIYINERHDDRLRLMHSYEQPIFIPDKHDRNSVPDGFVPYFGYVRHIKQDLEQNYIAEICVPIIYRQYTMVGYIQVLNNATLDSNSFTLVSLVAGSIKKEISEYSNFEESKNICAIYDLTQSTISFSHPSNKYFARIFHAGDIIIFDLVLPNIKLTLRAKVDSIEPADKVFIVHCNLFNLNLKQLELIEQFLEIS